jgi:hypothetical protein
MGDNGNVNNDLTFFTKEPDATLLDRFEKTPRNDIFVAIVNAIALHIKPGT